MTGGNFAHPGAQCCVAGKQQDAHGRAGAQAFDRRFIALQNIENATWKTIAGGQFGQREKRRRRLRARLDHHRGAAQQSRNSARQGAKQRRSGIADNRHNTGFAAFFRAAQQGQRSVHLCRCRIGILAGFFDNQSGKMPGIAVQRIAQCREQGGARSDRFSRPQGKCRLRCCNRFLCFTRTAQRGTAQYLATGRIAHIEKARRHRQVGVAVDP